jgi:hypothetical protein
MGESGDALNDKSIKIKPNVCYRLPEGETAWGLRSPRSPHERSEVEDDNSAEERVYRQIYLNSSTHGTQLQYTKRKRKENFARDVLNLENF